MTKELEQVKEIIELRKRMDKQQKPIVKKLGDEIGYGRLMQLTEEMWREKAEFKGSELAVGACVSFMVICDHSIKDDNGHCKLCCGAGRVTKGVKDLADELRASNETINRQHEMAQKQEKTIKTLSNELRQLESVVSEHNSFLKFTYKQVERGMFSDCMGAETALSNIAHQPESPFKNPKWNWDVSHLPYAEDFHAKFPKEQSND